MYFFSCPKYESFIQLVFGISVENQHGIDDVPGVYVSVVGNAYVYFLEIKLRKLTYIIFK